MIIFDLDGTLADCEHRRHFVDPEKNEDVCFEYEEIDSHGCPLPGTDHKGAWRYDFPPFKEWKPDWQAFYEACDKDKPIYYPINFLFLLYVREGDDVEIWSGRSESVREKTEKWLKKHIFHFGIDSCKLKMRPIGDYTPDDELKERWLDEEIAKGKKIDFVFDDRPKVLRMWRRRGIFVFDCNQTGEEF